MRHIVAISCTLVIAGCGGNDQARPAPTPTPAQHATVPGGPGCTPASPLGDAPNDQGREVRGRGDGAELHGLLMVRRLPVRARDRVKIVWRMTGSGPLRAAAYAPDGTKAKLDWPPDPHGGSTYHRPGEEWGVGYRFTKPGCWHLTLERTSGRGDVWFVVRPS